MGLDCSHGAWNGAYSAFMRWRKMVAQVAGLPPLELMEGFFQNEAAGLGCATLYFGQPKGGIFDNSRIELEKNLPIKWECLKPSALHYLLSHSDCDGSIGPKRCAKIADALEPLVQLMPDAEGGGHIGNWRAKTQKFVDGLRAASAAGEFLRFR